MHLGFAIARSAFQCRRSVITQRLALSTGIGGNIYANFYDQAKCMFVHIPKCAGTSICSVLYGRSPWHFTANEIRALDRKKFYQYFRFTIVRDPFSRLLSAYNYAPADIEAFPLSPLKFIRRFPSFEEFVERGLSHDLVNGVRFLQPQSTYIYDQDNLLVDSVINLEALPSALTPIFDRLGVLQKSLPHLNPSTSAENGRGAYTGKMRKIVSDIYAEDFRRFGY